MYKINLSSRMDVVDDLDRPLTVKTRHEITEGDYNYRVAHCFIMSEEGNMILLQKLGDPLHENRGKWGSSVATCVHHGEDYFQAVNRALYEELFLEKGNLAFEGKWPLRLSRKIKFLSLYSMTLVNTPSFNTEHIETLKWHDLQSLNEKRLSDPDSFTPTFLFALKRFLHAGS